MQGGRYTRRRLIQAGGTGLVAALAGCSALSSDDELEERVETLEAETEELQNELETLREELREQLAAVQAENEQLRADLESLTADTAELRTDLQSTQADLERVISDFETVREPFKEELSATQIRDHIERIQEENESLQEQVDALQHFSDDVHEAASEVGEQVRPGVVSVRAGNQLGTGWCYDESSVLTNAHVVRQEGSLVDETTLRTIDGDDRTATVAAATDRRSDLDVALLELEDGETTSHVLETGSFETVADEQPLISVGHPIIFRDGWVVSLGKLKERDASRSNFYKQLPTAQRASGSPVVTLDGTVVGMLWGIGQAPDVDLAEFDPGPTTPLEDFDFREAEQSRAVSDSIDAVESEVQTWL